MKKIMFNDRYGLTEAVLEGRKTMTRRIVSIPETWHGIDVCAIGPDTDKRSLLLYDADEFLIEDRNTGLCGQVMPLYKIGEEVAVAQKYKDFRWPAPQRSDFQEILHSAGWDNKMFVQAAVMPHRIRITNIRIERIQDISDEDCMREGVRKLESDGCPTMFTFDGWRFKNKVNRCTDSPKEVFEALFKKLSGKKAWDDNPWVFVYEFELVK